MLLLRDAAQAVAKGSAFRPGYPNWQRVHNVSFRVVCGVDAKKVVLGK